jgi:hypothetical protein
MLFCYSTLAPLRRACCAGVFFTSIDDTLAKCCTMTDTSPSKASSWSRTDSDNAIARTIATIWHGTRWMDVEMRLEWAKVYPGRISIPSSRAVKWDMLIRSHLSMMTKDILFEKSP